MGCVGRDQDRDGGTLEGDVAERVERSVEGDRQEQGSCAKEYHY